MVYASLPEKLKTFIPSLELDAYNNDYEALIKKDGTFTMKIEKLRVLKFWKKKITLTQVRQKTYVSLKKMLRFTKMTLNLGIIKLLATGARV